MKTVQSPLPMSFAVENISATEAFCAGGASGLVPKVAAAGLASLKEMEDCLGTLINGEFMAPPADELADVLSRRYSLAQYAGGVGGSICECNADGGRPCTWPTVTPGPSGRWTSR